MMDMQTSRCSKLVDVAFDGYAVSPGERANILSERFLPAMATGTPGTLFSL